MNEIKREALDRIEALIEDTCAKPRIPESLWDEVEPHFTEGEFRTFKIELASEFELAVEDFFTEGVTFYDLLDFLCSENNPEKDCQ